MLESLIGLGHLLFLSFPTLCICMCVITHCFFKGRFEISSRSPVRLSLTITPAPQMLGCASWASFEHCNTSLDGLSNKFVTAQSKHFSVGNYCAIAYKGNAGSHFGTTTANNSSFSGLLLVTTGNAGRPNQVVDSGNNSVGRRRNGGVLGSEGMGVMLPCGTIVCGDWILVLSLLCCLDVCLQNVSEETLWRSRGLPQHKGTMSPYQDEASMIPHSHCKREYMVFWCGHIGAGIVTWGCSHNTPTGSGWSDFLDHQLTHCLPVAPGSALRELSCILWFSHSFLLFFCLPQPKSWEPVLLSSHPFSILSTIKYLCFFIPISSG